MLGGYGMTAITAITAQNTLGVQSVETLSSDFVCAQIDSCLDDIGADAVKIGMLGSADIAQAVARRLDAFAGPIVFDPVMVATTGAVLADQYTIAAFAMLMDIATLVTPNLPELAALTGFASGRCGADRRCRPRACRAARCFRAGQGGPRFGRAGGGHPGYARWPGRPVRRCSATRRPYPRHRVHAFVRHGDLAWARPAAGPCGAAGPPFSCVRQSTRRPASVAAMARSATRPSGAGTSASVRRSPRYGPRPRPPFRPR